MESTSFTFVYFFIASSDCQKYGATHYAGYCYKIVESHYDTDTGKSLGCTRLSGENHLLAVAPLEDPGTHNFVRNFVRN